MTDLSTQNSAPTWVRWWFRGAAIYGTLGLLSLLTRTAPGGDVLFYYGFIGTALAFQLAFWIIGGDPVRHRPLMLAGVVEKLGFVLPTVALLISLGGVGNDTLVAGLIDLTLGIGFVLAWRATPRM